jgi:RimJ/RimL family protein N-acetyltransferase
MFAERAIRLADGRTATLRQARPDDAEAWVEHCGRVAAEGIFLMMEQFTRTPAEVRQQFAEADPRSSLWLIAEVDGRVVGGGNFLQGRWAKNAHTAELGMAVHPAFRRLGIGAAILDAGIEWARGAGIRKLKLGVFASNVPAIRLYRKFGFQEEGRLKDEVVLEGRPVDELLMAVWLDRRGASTDPPPGFVPGEERRAPRGR